ncbi:YqjF family protein [Natrinema sp. H-ect1]|uniref:YqjF family protein n=1 Tax=Natrinema sp. H-ect1 TaxID=3242700 RepID=UPI00359DAAA9
MSLPIAMGWRHLLFANWAVDPGIVAARLPDGLEVETYDGRAWLSVVPYLNVDVRPRGVPAAAGVDLPELNLRTYVSRDGEPGVYFFSLDAEGVLGVVGARLFHRLPYYYADIEISGTERGIAFASERRHPGAAPAEFVGTYEPVGDAFKPEPGSLAAFLTEHYRYYTTARDGTVRYADIDHEPWTLRAATAEIERNTLFEANGFDAPAGTPVCYYSRGVDIASSRNRRWE